MDIHDITLADMAIHELRFNRNAARYFSNLAGHRGQLVGQVVAHEIEQGLTTKDPILEQTGLVGAGSARPAVRVSEVLAIREPNRTLRCSVVFGAEAGRKLNEMAGLKGQESEPFLAEALETHLIRDPVWKYAGCKVAASSALAAPAAA